MKKNIQVMIVEDSAVSTQLLRVILEEVPDIQVIACAKDGVEALELTEKFHPDLITMDVFMPNMDGVEATKAIMDRCPTPIIVISTHANEDETSYVFNTLQAGALTIIEKPRGVMDKNFDKLKRNIINAVRSLSEIHVTRRPAHSHKNKINKSAEIHVEQKIRPQIVVLGSSTGGPVALNTILSKLSEDFSIPIAITQHISPGFLSGLVNWLQKNSKLKLEIAQHQQILKAGTVYFAPDNTHLMLENHLSPMAVLDDSPPIKHFKPSINVLFSSAAKHFPKTAVGGLLTGMGQDGAEGLLEMKKSGCPTFAQSMASSTVFGMPSAAITIGATSHVIELDQIADYLTILLKRGNPSSSTS